MGETTAGITSMTGEMTQKALLGYERPELGACRQTPWHAPQTQGEAMGPVGSERLVFF